MAGGFAPAQVIVVERGEIIVDERVGMDQFQRRGRREEGTVVVPKKSTRLKTEDRPYTLPSREDRVAHGPVDRVRDHLGARQQLLQSAIHPGALLLQELPQLGRRNDTQGAP